MTDLLRERIVAVLEAHAAELRDLHHQHVVLDANARAFIAGLVTAEVTAYVTNLEKKYEYLRLGIGHVALLIDLGKEVAVMRDLANPAGREDPVAAVAAYTTAQKKAFTLVTEWEGRGE